MAKQEHIWYVEPLDDNTNKVIGQQLAELAKENFSPKITCGDGKQRNLWRCSYRFALSLTKSKNSLNLNFEIWGKLGRHGKITKKTFLFSSKWRRKKKTKTAP